MTSMFQLTNAQGKTVDLNSNSLRSYTPIGLGLYMTNTYSVYNSSFIRTNSQLTDPTSNPYEVYIQFGDISSQSYQTFSDFASFLAYPPYTLVYRTDAGTWYREANLQSITKTEIGGSTIIAADRLNETFILEFYTAWYQLQSEEYVSYSDDPNLGLYGKIYNTSIKRNATDDSASFPDQTLINSSGIDLASIHDNGSATGTIQVSGSSEIQNALVSVKDNDGNIVGSQQLNTSPNPDQTVAAPSDTIIIHDNSDGSSTLSTKVTAGQSIQLTQNTVGLIYSQANLGYNNLTADSEMLLGLQSASTAGWNNANTISTILSGVYTDSIGKTHNAIQIASTSASTSNVVVSKNIVPTLNSTYYWSVWYKVTGTLSTAASVHLEGRGIVSGSDAGTEAEALISTTTAVGNWIQLTGSFTPTSSSTAYLRLRFQNLGTGTILFSEPMINSGSQLNAYISDTVDATQWSLKVTDGYLYLMEINAHEVDFTVLPQNTGYNFSFTFPHASGNYIFDNGSETFAFILGSNLNYLFPYTYIESGRNLNQKAIPVSNSSEYFGLQNGSPCLITITGPTTTNVSWEVLQNGITIASDAFDVTLTDNQQLVVSSYPEDQYARIYNPDGSYVNISQYQDITKTNYILIPEGDSTIVFYIDKTAGVQLTYKEERLLV
ncbi:phage distal tail protein domain-containing protein [Oenococcus oeni]|uniref:phage distal tail protein domain-containing protein n=1 Tax=Oenococcus oeni TaxID=1247 RepID=UPI0010B69E77|nr:phage distal tail protein domain-containing protein [Oenococcus oeni]SYW19475.1 conserved hypothetical protein [Oenococcus oeni]